MNQLPAGQQKITVTFAGDNLEGSVASGYQQRGLLSPLLWSLVVDEPIEGRSESGCYTPVYAGDIAVLIGGKFLNTVQELFQEALIVVQ